MRLIYLLVLFNIFSSCQNDSSKSSNQKISIQYPKSVSVEPLEEVELLVYINNLRLREGPNEKVIAALPKNTIVKYKGETSMFRTRVKMRGMELNAPWLFVKTEDGQQGWIYGGGIKPKTSDETRATKIIDDIHLNSVFENYVVQKIEDYSKQWDAIQTSSDFAKTYLFGEKVQEDINEVLGERVAINDPSNLMDMGWLERSMIGYQNSLAAEATQFYLFQNYKLMHQKAVQSEGTEDDDFIELQFKVCAFDSIEHFYKSWFFQTWDYGGHSLLGQGKHLEILSEMNTILSRSKLFEKPILELKNELIKDIIDEHITYWEPKDKILDELRNIINANFVLLNKNDLIGLKARKKMFEKPIANKIEVNKRAG